MTFFGQLTVGNFNISRAFSLGNKPMTSITFESREMLLQPLSGSFKGSSPTAKSSAKSKPTSNPTPPKLGVMDILKQVTDFELNEAAQCVKESLPHYDSPSALSFASEAIKKLYLQVLEQIPRSPLRLNKSDSLDSPAVILKINRKRQDLILEVAQSLVGFSAKAKPNSMFTKTLHECRNNLKWIDKSLINHYPLHCEWLGWNGVADHPSSQEAVSNPSVKSEPWAQLDSISRLIPEKVTRPLYEGSIDAESILQTIESIESQLYRLKEQVLSYRNKQTFHQQNVKRNVNPFEEMI